MEVVLALGVLQNVYCGELIYWYQLVSWNVVKTLIHSTVFTILCQGQVEVNE